jgi:3-oxoacyl-(acyl-carrier-protein) synthase
MNLYINGAGVISPQKTYDRQIFLSEITSYESNVLTCVLPEFSEYINPLKLRRLSRMLKMGLTAATICLRDAQLEKPDAIITSTGYGLQGDMEKFLIEVLEQKEEQLTPTYFMQSTYNALAGLIALSLRCTGYNNTHVGKGAAFESALLDAILLLNEREAQDVLLGAFDEFSPIQHCFYTRNQYLKTDIEDNLKLFETNTPGTLHGEGTAFFLLSSSLKDHSLCRLKDVRMLYKPADDRELSSALDNFLKENSLESSDIDVFLNGASGDVLRDIWNTAICRDYLQHAAEVRFKHLTGEYATASSFGLWLGAMILKNGRIPDAVLVDPLASPRRIKNVLFCNHFLARNYTFMLLESTS